MADTSIIARIGADTTSFTRGLQKTQAQAVQWQRNMGSIARQAVAFFSFTYIASWFGKAIERSRELKKQSIETGKTIESLQRATFRLSAAEVDAVNNMGKVFDDWKDRALTAIGKVLVGIDAVRTAATGTGINQAETDLIAARAQARREIKSDGRVSINSPLQWLPGLGGTGPLSLGPRSAENQAAVEARAQEILGEQARVRLELRRSFDELDAVLDQRRAAMSYLRDYFQEMEQGQQNERDRHADVVKLLDEEFDALDRQLDTARQLHKEEQAQLATRKASARAAADTLSAWRSNTMISLGEASDDVGAVRVPSGVRQKATRASRLLRRATEARLRGNTGLADDLQSRADAIRNSLPGVRGDDVQMDQLDQLKTIANYTANLQGVGVVAGKSGSART